MPSDMTRGNGHKNEIQEALSELQEHFFTVRVTKHWHRLPREVVKSPLLQILKSLDIRHGPGQPALGDPA